MTTAPCMLNWWHHHSRGPSHWQIFFDSVPPADGDCVGGVRGRRQHRQQAAVDVRAPLEAHREAAITDRRQVAAAVCTNGQKGVWAGRHA